MLNGTHRSKNHIARTFLPGRLHLGRFAQGTRAALWEKDAPAQGMVEFALVLPILLLIIFGIIAFGHFFFSYSLVVAASRDAARFGSAVGLTNNSLPRYRDCKEIRNAAVGTGGLAGVTDSDTNISITYDKGPKANGDPADLVVDDLNVAIGCPKGGIGPGIIELGDRIVVTVTVKYTPIVPLVPIENINLTATTRRTIMLGMPVGDQAIAEKSKCVGTLTRIVMPNYDPTLMGSVSRIGEIIDYPYEVIPDDPDETAQGTLYFYVNDTKYTTPIDTTSAPIGNYKRAWTELTPMDSPIILLARYDPGTYATTTPCYDPSKAEPLRHFVIAANTVTTILDLTKESFKVGETETIRVEVKPDLPATLGRPTGQVVVTGEGDGEVCTITLIEDPIENKSYGSCDLKFTQINNRNTITATYDKDPGTNPLYNSSFATVDVDVDRAAEEPTLGCPAFQNVTEFSGSTMTLYIQNGKNYDIELDNIHVEWNTGVSLINVNVGNTTSTSVLKSASPTDVQLDSTLGLGSITMLRLEFNSQLPDGTYTVTGNLGTLGEGCPSITKSGILDAYP